VSKPAMKSFMEREILTDEGAGQLSASLARGQGSRAKERKVRGRSPASSPGPLSFGVQPGAILAAQMHRRAGCTVLDARCSGAFLLPCGQATLSG